MLFLCLTLPFFLSGSSSADKEVCYGREFNLDDYAPPFFRGKVFFTPTNTGVRRLVMDNGEVKDPRFWSSFGSGLHMTDLTEQDNGVFSVSHPINDQVYKVIKLKITDCKEPETKYYGKAFSFMVPIGAELLEFTPARNLNQVIVVWNHTDPNGGRGSVKRHYWDMYDVTQEDSGYYKFRGKHNKLLSWKKLLVQEPEENRVLDEGNQLHLEYRHIAHIWTISFKPEGKLESHTLLKQNTPNWNAEPFEERIDFRDAVITIDPVQYQDSGAFEFRDVKGYLAWRVEVEVIREEHPLWGYVVPIAGFVFGVILCCCVKKFCKNSSSKRDAPDPQTAAAAAPAVHHHDTTQPTGRSNSAAPTSPVYSYRPLNPPSYNEAMAASDDPPTYESVNITVSPPQLEVHEQVAAPGGPGATPPLSNHCDLASSDPDPTFDVTGTTVPSGPPLSSNTNFSDVYTSDKLNFL